MEVLDIAYKIKFLIMLNLVAAKSLFLAIFMMAQCLHVVLLDSSIATR